MTLVKAKTIFWVGTLLLVAALLLLPEPSQFLAGRLNEQALELELSGEDAQAKALLMCVLKLQEKNLGVNHADIAKCLDELSSVCVSLGELDQAEVFSQRALKIRESRYGKSDPELTDTYLNLARIYCKQGASSKAVPFLEKAWALGATVLVPKETRFGAGSYIATERLYFSVSTLLSDKKYAEAQPVIKRLVACHYGMFGDEIDVRRDLNLYCEFLELTNGNGEAEKLKVLLSSGNKLTRHDLEPYMLSQPNPADLIYHPILKSMAGHGLEGIDLPSSAFRRLNGAVFPNLMLYKLREFFGRAETDALECFCVRVKGLSKSQIETLAGKPMFQGGRVGCWSFSKLDEDIWVYRLGYLESAARLTFANDRCILSKVCTSDEDFSFQEWRAAQMVRWAQGKTLAQILSEFGLPKYCRNVMNRDVSPTDHFVLETIDYDTGPGTLATLTIKRGVCTAGSVGLVVH